MKLRDFRQRVEDLKHAQEIKDLKHTQEIKHLDWRLDCVKKEFVVKEQEIKLECQRKALECKKNEVEATADLKQEVAAQAAHIEELRVRLEDAPYEQLSEILRALVVKLPTLNISELAVSTKEK